MDVKAKEMDKSTVIKIIRENKDPKRISSIIEWYYQNNMINFIFSCITDDNLLKDTVNKYIKNNGDLKKVVIDILIDEKIVKKIIDIYINEDNVIGAINALHNIKIFNEYIFKNYKDMIKSNVMNLSKADMIKNIFSFNAEIELANMIYDLREREVNKIIDNRSKYNLLYVISPIRINEPFKDIRKDVRGNLSYAELMRISKSSKVCDYIYTKYSSDVIDSLRIKNVLLFLNDSLIANSIKELVIEEKQDVIKNAIMKEDLNSLVNIFCLENNTLPSSIRKLIIELREKEIVEYLSNKMYKFSDFLYGNYNDYLNAIIVKHLVDDKSIFRVLKETEFFPNKTMIVLNEKDYYFRNYINNMPLEDIVMLNFGSINYFSNHLKETIVSRYKDIIETRLFSLDKDSLINHYNNKKTSRVIKKLILEHFIEDKEDSDILFTLINKYSFSFIIDNYNNIKKFIINSNINYESFIQYGSGSRKYDDWCNNIYDILKENKQEEFMRVLNYFNNNYYKNSTEVETINNYMEMLDKFVKHKSLLLNIVNNDVVIDMNVECNIKFLFRNDDYHKNYPKNLDELYDFKYNVNKSIIDFINKEKTSVYCLQNCINKNIFVEANEYLDNIGGVPGLEKLKKENRTSKYICDYIDELILYGSIIRRVNNCNNVDDLVKMIKYICNDDYSKLDYIQNLFFDYEKKLNKLYELEMRINLTSLKSVDEHLIIDDDLSRRYGGKVYNLSDKDYLLLAHIMSSNENIDDLINGDSDGKSNFISVSSISHMGQVYYHNGNGCTCCYDSINDGSFICSSVENMATNYKISKNSSEYEGYERKQRGVLETSAGSFGNSEILLLRKGLKPSGLILQGGRTPSDKELEWHLKYDIPFVVTQEIRECIENPKRIFNKNNYDIEFSKYSLNEKDKKELKIILDLIDINIPKRINTDIYTGREIGIFADAHGLYEPMESIIKDMKDNGINEIYSLGDNVGTGPSSSLVVDLLERNGVISVSGNAEYYQTCGFKPFESYFNRDKIIMEENTNKDLGELRIKKLKLYKPSIDLLVGDKKVALCHFANDVRWDYTHHSTWTFQNRASNNNYLEQFLYTNSDEAKRRLERMYKNNPNDALKDALERPIFDGKRITDYDTVIQGHVHFAFNDVLNNTNIHTLRGVSMGYYDESKRDTARYYILKEKKDGTFDVVYKDVDFSTIELQREINDWEIDSKYKNKIRSFTMLKRSK